MKKLLVLGVALALTSAAFAIPTVNGPTGGFEVENAAVATGVQFAVDEATTGGLVVPNTRVLVGVLPNLELGARYLDTGITTTWGLNAKYALPIDLGGGALAVGAEFLDNGAPADNNPWDVFLAGTWPLTETGDVEGTLNVKYSDPDTAADKDTSFGLAVQQNFDNGSAAGIEWLFSREGMDDSGNLFVIVPLNDTVTARLALAGINAGTGWYAGLTYAYGGAAE